MADVNCLPEKVNPAGQLIQRFAQKYGVDPARLNDTLKATAFSLPAVKDDDGRRSPQVVTNEQMAALLIVADQYGLNPFTREIYAFPDKKGGIVPVVGVDGWVRIINEHPQFDGMEFRQSESMVMMDDDAKPAPEWIEVIVYRKDRSRPMIVREYLDECYRPAFKGNKGQKNEYTIAGPWQTHTKRFLRHKAIIQAGRVAFGFAGIHDNDEADDIINVTPFAQLAEQPAIPAPPDWDRLMFCMEGAKLDRVREFVEGTAKVKKASVVDVVADAINQIDKFRPAFDAWLAKKDKKNAEKGNATTAVPVAESGGFVAGNPVGLDQATGQSAEPGNINAEDGPDADEMRLIAISEQLEAASPDVWAKLSPDHRERLARMKDKKYSDAMPFAFMADVAAMKTPDILTRWLESEGF